ncbi:unnamed protein product [Rhodiola kirilowii]
MALHVHSSSLFLPHGLPPRATNLLIQCQKPSSEPASEESASASSASAAGVGFGSSKQQRSTASGRGERAAVIRRRLPVEKPDLVSRPVDNKNGEERGRNESAFLLTWSALGAVILAQGLTLAASGFLPEEWDRFLVKYLYPIFTPTVGLFVAGTAAYGVLKYLQNDQLKK